MDVDLEAQRPRHRFTVTEYYQLGEFSILNPDARVELIEGDIIEMPPIGPPHASIVSHLSKVLVQAVANTAEVRIQSPIHLSDRDEPQPDLCLVQPADSYYQRHPEPADVLLAIEVADSSVTYDRVEKGRLYSRSSIPEYWLVDIPAARIEIYRSPGPEGYSNKQELTRGDTVAPLAIPDLLLDVADILGPR